MTIKPGTLFLINTVMAIVDGAVFSETGSIIAGVCAIVCGSAAILCLCLIREERDEQ